MEKLSAWLFLLIAIMWLLPLVKVDRLAPYDGWISVIALAIIAIMGIAKGK